MSSLARRSLVAFAAALSLAAVACGKESSDATVGADAPEVVTRRPADKGANQATSCHGTEPFWSIAIDAKNVKYDREPRCDRGGRYERRIRGPLPGEDERGSEPFPQCHHHARGRRRLQRRDERRGLPVQRLGAQRQRAAHRLLPVIRQSASRCASSRRAL
jgi:hypothetical protein